nr:TIR domain-containing protein [uncultured Methanoregula sp.]
MGGGLRLNRKVFADKRNIPVERSDTKPQKSIKDYSTKKPKVFISFHIDDEAQVNLLRHQAKNSEQLEFDDRSVKEPFDEEWKRQCTERIKKSDIIIVAIGEHTHEREAVEWEINKAHELGVPVIGMRIYKDENHKVPKSMVEHKDKVIPWDLEKIQEELDKKT